MMKHTRGSRPFHCLRSLSLAGLLAAGAAAGATPDELLDKASYDQRAVAALVDAGAGRNALKDPAIISSTLPAIDALKTEMHRDPQSDDKRAYYHLRFGDKERGYLNLITGSEKALKLEEAEWQPVAETQAFDALLAKPLVSSRKDGAAPELVAFAVVESLYLRAGLRADASPASLGELAAVFATLYDNCIAYRLLSSDDYPAWFVETRELQRQLLETCAGAWKIVLEMAASTRAELLRKDELLREWKRKAADDPQREALLAEVREARRGIQECRELQQQLLDAAEGGHKQIEERLKKKEESLEPADARRAEVVRWKKEIEEQREETTLAFRVMMSQEASTRDQFLAEIEAKDTAATDIGEKLRYVRARMMLGAYRAALEPARKLAKDHPDSAEAREVFRDVEVALLGQIYSKLRQDRELVDRVLADWGGGQINVQTGEWQTAGFWNTADLAWGRWMAVVTGRTYWLWGYAEDEKAAVAQQIVGMHLLIHLRKKGVAMQDMPRDGEEIITHLPGNAVFPAGHPGREAQRRQLEDAIFQILENKDVQTLVNNEPFPERLGLYADLKMFGDEWAITTGTSQFLFYNVAVPVGVGAAGMMVATIPRVAQVIAVINANRWGRAALAPAVVMARWQERIARIPGVAGVAVKGGDFVIQAYLIGCVSQKAEELATAMGANAQGAGSYGSLAINLLTGLYQGAGYSINAAARTASELARRKELLQFAEERVNLLAGAAKQNEDHLAELQKLIALSRQPQPDLAAIRGKARLMTGALDDEVKSFGNASGKLGYFASLDEKFRLRSAFKFLESQGATSAEVEKEIRSIFKLARSRATEVDLAKAQTEKLKKILAPPPPDAPPPPAEDKSDCERAFREGQQLAEGRLARPHSDPEGVWNFDKVVWSDKFGCTHVQLQRRLKDFVSPDKAYGKSVRELQLAGKSADQIKAELSAAGFGHTQTGIQPYPRWKTNPATGKDEIVAYAYSTRSGEPIVLPAVGGKRPPVEPKFDPNDLSPGALAPMDLYVHPLDGGMVRVKPFGDNANRMRPQPHSSKSVLLNADEATGRYADTSWANEGFKVTDGPGGTPVPRAPLPDSGMNTSWAVRPREPKPDNFPTEYEKGYLDYLMGKAHTDLPKP